MSVIYLDPGHGAEDPGAIGVTGLKEADVNWNVTQKAKQYLERMGHEVRFTRSEHECPLQWQRRDYAAPGDVLVSIHHNSSTYSDARGMECLIWPDRHDSAVLALLILGHLYVTAGRVNRGIVVRQLPVLAAKPPTALVEAAFLSNPDEEWLLKQEWFREKLAVGIAYGIRDFVNQALWRG